MMALYIYKIPIFVQVSDDGLTPYDLCPIWRNFTNYIVDNNDDNLAGAMLDMLEQYNARLNNDCIEFVYKDDLIEFILRWS